MGLLTVISTEPQVFSNRAEAGGILADYLDHLRGTENLVILGIPRGGVVVADPIAQSLNALLDIVLTRKIGAPSNPELAIGAVSENGDLYLNDDLIQMLGVSDRYVEKNRDAQWAEIESRRQRFRRVLPKVPLEGRTVVITDDGIATGATMQAGIWAARSEKAARIILAVPVAPPDSISRLREQVDELICLSMPSVFYAIGQFYGDFEQVTDSQVVDILSKYRSE